MFVLEHFKVLLKIFYWTGLAPSTMLNKKDQCFPYIISVVISAVINVGFVVSSFQFHSYSTYGNIQRIVNCVVVSSLALSNLVANLQCYRHKSVYNSIFGQMMKVENNFNAKFPGNTSFQTVFKRYRLKCIVVCVPMFISFVLYYIGSWVEHDYEVLIIFCFIVFTQIMSALVLFHILLYVTIVQMFIGEMNRRIKNNAPNCFYNKSKIEFLKTIKILHMETWKLMAEINKFFSWNLPYLMINLAIQTTNQV